MPDTSGGHAQTLRERAIIQLRKDIDLIYRDLETYAGKPNKPPQVTESINHLISNIEKPLHTLTVQGSTPAERQLSERWEKFKTEWKLGRGSWTNCKGIASYLVGYANGLE